VGAVKYGKPNSRPGQGQRVRAPSGVQEPAPSARSASDEDIRGDRIPEEQVDFDPVAGHTHDGTDSAPVDHADLTGVTANQHHNQSHVLASSTAIGADHTVSGLTAARALRSISATDVAFDGDILDNNARVAVRKNSAGSVFTRRRLNFIEGSNVTLTVADDGGNEEVDVTIAASGGSSGTIVRYGPWTTADASGLTGSYVAQTLGAGGGAFVQVWQVFPYPSGGTIVGIEMDVEADLGDDSEGVAAYPIIGTQDSGGGTKIADVTDVTATLNCTTASGGDQWMTAWDDTPTDGDIELNELIGVVALKSGSPNAVNVDYYVWVRLN
jgi:hypothetical protein